MHDNDAEDIKRATAYTKALNNSLKQTLNTVCKRQPGWDELTPLQQEFIKIIVVNNTRI